MAITLLNIDCMEYMATVPDKYFDLAIVDPPYGIGDFTRSTSHGRKIKRNYSRPKWNDSIPDKGYFNELKRISKRRIIWGANYFNCFETGGALIWYKNTGPDTLSQCAIASLSFQKKIDYIHINHLNGSICNDEIKIHPCQSPIKLYKWILKNYAKPKFKIIDTHGGSMSSVIAAYDFGIAEMVCCEIDKEYYDAAVKRFETHKLQQKINFK